MKSAQRMCAAGLFCLDVFLDVIANDFGFALPVHFEDRLLSEPFDDVVPNDRVARAAHYDEGLYEVSRAPRRMRKARKDWLGVFRHDAECPY